MTGKISEFGPLGERAARSHPSAPARVRHVTVTVDDQAHPGLLLEWARDKEGAWVAQVAYLNSEPEALVVAWVSAGAVEPAQQARTDRGPGTCGWPPGASQVDPRGTLSGLFG